MVAGFQGCAQEPTAVGSLIWCIPLLIQAWTSRTREYHENLYVSLRNYFQRMFAIRIMYMADMQTV